MPWERDRPEKRFLVRELHFANASRFD